MLMKRFEIKWVKIVQMYNMKPHIFIKNNFYSIVLFALHRIDMHLVDFLYSVRTELYKFSLH